MSVSCHNKGCVFDKDNFIVYLLVCPFICVVLASINFAAIVVLCATVSKCRCKVLQTWMQSHARFSAQNDKNACNKALDILGGFWNLLLFKCNQSNCTTQPFSYPLSCQSCLEVN